VTLGDLTNPGTEIFAAGVNEFSGAGGTRSFKLCIIQINRDSTRATECGTGNGAQAYASATEDNHGVTGDDSASRDSMHTNGEWLNKAEFFE
jgi:hypothetical protein